MVWVLILIAAPFTFAVFMAGMAVGWSYPQYCAYCRQIINIRKEILARVRGGDGK